MDLSAMMMRKKIRRRISVSMGSVGMRKERSRGEERVSFREIEQGSWKKQRREDEPSPWYV